MRLVISNINTSRYKLPLVFGAETVFYRVKIESADSHQVRWFSTEIPPYPRSTALGYPDPELEISFNNEEILVTSNGIPTFEFVSAKPNGLRGQDFKWVIPRFPEPADDLTQIPLLGTAVITTVGLPIYGPNEALHPHP